MVDCSDTSASATSRWVEWISLSTSLLRFDSQMMTGRQVCKWNFQTVENTPNFSLKSGLPWFLHRIGNSKPSLLGWSSVEGSP